MPNTRKGGARNREEGEVLPPPMNPEGLAEKWESTEDARRVVRDHGFLVTCQRHQKWAEPTRLNCVQNMAVLLPCLEVLAGVPEWRLPHLVPLQQQVRSFFEMSAMDAGSSLIYRHAMEIKKMLGFVKRKAMRKEVTKAGLQCPHIYLHLGRSNSSAELNCVNFFGACRLRMKQDFHAGL